MPDNSFGSITLSAFKGKYVVLFFYPLDFTFVCPSEILAFNKKVAEFKAKKLRTDRCFGRLQIHSPGLEEYRIENGGIGNIQYPLCPGP